MLVVANVATNCKPQTPHLLCLFQTCGPQTQPYIDSSDIFLDILGDIVHLPEGFLQPLSQAVILPKTRKHIVLRKIAIVSLLSSHYCKCEAGNGAFYPSYSMPFACPHRKMLLNNPNRSLNPTASHFLKKVRGESRME